MDLRLALIGLMVGLCVGISGVGGSSLMTPLLILFFGIKPIVAVGTDLMYSVPTKVLGAVVHHKQGTVDRKVVLFLSLGGIPATLLGLTVLALLQVRLSQDALNATTKQGVGVLLFLAAVAILLTPLLRRARHRSEGAARRPAPPRPPPRPGAGDGDLDARRCGTLDRARRASRLLGQPYLDRQRLAHCARPLPAHAATATTPTNWLGRRLRGLGNPRSGARSSADGQR